MNKYKYIIYICLGILLYLRINSLDGFSIGIPIWLREIGTEHFVDAETLNLPLVPAPEGQDHETRLLETVEHYLDILPIEGGLQGHFEIAPVECVAQSSSPYMDEVTDVTLEAEKSMANDVRIINKEIYCQLKQEISQNFNIIYGAVQYEDTEKDALSNSFALSIIGMFINLTGQRIIFGGITTIRSLLNHNLDACAAIASCFEIDYSTLNPNHLLYIINIVLSEFRQNTQNFVDDYIHTIDDNIDIYICFSIILSDTILSNDEDKDKKIYFFIVYILRLYSSFDSMIDQTNYKEELKKIYIYYWCYDSYPSIRNSIKNEIHGWGGDLEDVPDNDVFRDFTHQGRLTLFADYPSLFRFLSDIESFMKWYSKFCDTSDT